MSVLHGILRLNPGDTRYRSKLKGRIQSDFKEKLYFLFIDKNTPEVVINRKAIESQTLLSDSAQIVEQAAMLLRGEILNYASSILELAWPIDLDELNSDTRQPPANLAFFVSVYKNIQIALQRAKVSPIAISAKTMIEFPRSKKRKIVPKEDESEGVIVHPKKEPEKFPDGNAVIKSSISWDVARYLSYLQKLAKEANMLFVNVTLDVGAAMNVYKLIWNYSRIFENIVVHLGDFHFIKENFGDIGKIIKCSGFEDVVFQASVCSPGSLNGVLGGTHYNRAWTVHATFSEALERLLFERFSEECNLEVNYARYGSFYVEVLFQMEKLYPGLKGLLREKGMSVQAQEYFPLRVTIDQRGEQTLNRDAKTTGRITHFASDSTGESPLDDRQSRDERFRTPENKSAMGAIVTKRKHHFTSSKPVPLRSTITPSIIFVQNGKCQLPKNPV
eukprot:gene11282-21474_t